MIYTLGKKSIYEPLFKDEEQHYKDTGGSVWKTLAEADAHRGKEAKCKNYGIYGVDASWENDTEFVEGKSWRALKKPAKLIKLPPD